MTIVTKTIDMDMRMGQDGYDKLYSMTFLDSVFVLAMYIQYIRRDCVCLNIRSKVPKVKIISFHN